jgi:dihydroneopterin aldolase
MRPDGQKLTVNGRAELIVQDAASYQKLLELLDYAEAVEGIKQGLESMRRGEGRPAAEVFQHLRNKHQIPHDATYRVIIQPNAEAELTRRIVLLPAGTQAAARWFAGFVEAIP